MSASNLQESEVRIAHSLNLKEVACVKKRRSEIWSSLKTLGINCSQDKVPNIALLGSGGGQRAMVGLLGSLDQLDKTGLLKCLLYLSGVSGSTWCMASLYQEPNWSTELQTVKEKIVSRISGPPVSWSDAYAKLKKYYIEKEYFSLTHVWAAMVITTYVKEIDERTFTDWLGQSKNNPFPIYTLIDKECKQSGDGDPWFEISPCEAGYSLTGAFVKTSSFGSQFVNGRKKTSQPEMDMLLLQALCGSALADGEENIKFLWGKIKGLFKHASAQMIEQMEEDPTLQHVEPCTEVLEELVDINICLLDGEDPTTLDHSIRKNLKEPTPRPPGCAAQGWFFPRLMRMLRTAIDYALMTFKSTACRRSRRHRLGLTQESSVVKDHPCAMAQIISWWARKTALPIRPVRAGHSSPKEKNRSFPGGGWGAPTNVCSEPKRAAFPHSGCGSPIAASIERTAFQLSALVHFATGQRMSSFLAPPATPLDPGRKLSLRGNVSDRSGDAAHLDSVGLVSAAQPVIVAHVSGLKLGYAFQFAVGLPSSRDLAALAVTENLAALVDLVVLVVAEDLAALEVAVAALAVTDLVVAASTLAALVAVPSTLAALVALAALAVMALAMAFQEQEQTRDRKPSCELEDWKRPCCAPAPWPVRVSGQPSMSELSPRQSFSYLGLKLDLRLLGHMTLVAITPLNCSYETNSALASQSSPQMGMVHRVYITTLGLCTFSTWMDLAFYGPETETPPRYIPAVMARFREAQVILLFLPSGPSLAAFFALHKGAGSQLALVSPDKSSENEYTLEVCEFLDELQMKLNINWPVGLKMWIRIFVCMAKWTWGRNYDFLYNMRDPAVPAALLKSQTRDYEDAGLLLNSPYFSVLRTERNVDLIISLDFSEGDPFLTVKEAAEACSKLKIPFPPINLLDEDIKNPKDFYVFKSTDKKAPTVIHIPLFNVINCGDELGQYRKKYRTFQGAYSAEMIKDLMNVAGKNVSNNKQKLINVINEVIRQK
ncbi:uncharacterized protein zmp:0000000629 [Danio aesculapii]|uniref:uncharacterized protein zmp:0000000629 n=1 Tax=Danio aesculapii TaxID=1142201 RepID=UPI0024C06E40|nr:uncharacterized protein zmp:0000000629 [Danio aesculapii]